METNLCLQAGNLGQRFCLGRGQRKGCEIPRAHTEPLPRIQGHGRAGEQKTSPGQRQPPPPRPSPPPSLPPPPPPSPPPPPKRISGCSSGLGAGGAVGAAAPCPSPDAVGRRSPGLQELQSPPGSTASLAGPLPISARRGVRGGRRAGGCRRLGGWLAVPGTLAGPSCRGRGSAAASDAMLGRVAALVAAPRRSTARTACG